jgi:FKBP-type peptidyl-prolyl cis-trans isomerase FkpA
MVSFALNLNLKNFKKSTMSKKIFNLIFAASAVFLIISASSCNPSQKYEEDEQNAITTYLGENPTLIYELKPSGLYYLQVLEGTGSLPVKSDTAYVIYTGMFLNGIKFDTNVGKDTLVFPVAEGWMISGFDEAITYMKKGGKASVVVPSKLGYGPSGYYMIGGYTPLLYEIELARIVKGPTK